MNYLTDSSFDGLYHTYPSDKTYEFPSYRFRIEFPFGTQLKTLSRILVKSIRLSHGLQGTHRQVVLSSVQRVLNDSATTYSYGPDMRSLVDNHGAVIRSAGTADQIREAYESCSCGANYKKFFDREAQHVRTMDPRICGSLLAAGLARGLNFRPPIRLTFNDLLRRVEAWSRSVLEAALDGIYTSFIPRILEKCIHLLVTYKVIPHHGLNAGSPSLAALQQAAATVTQHIVCISTDKAANTCSFECISHYRYVCLQRLLSPAFAPIGPQQDWTQQMDLVEKWTPWAIDQKFSCAILFCMPKRHKNPMTYRYITSACAAPSDPVSAELTRVLTFIMAEARSMCIELGTVHDCKFWWSIDSLDIPPFNIGDLNVSRQPSVFDIEKCFEAVPLIRDQLSDCTLIEHVSHILDLTFSYYRREWVGSKMYNGKPSKKIFWCAQSSPHFAIKYSKSDLLAMVTDLLSMTVISVGDVKRMQSIGIPMGFRSSVILLNMYAFWFEYCFVWRLLQLQPTLASHTKLLFRYVDDLGNFSNLDLRYYLDPEQTYVDDNPFWIYKLAPAGPLSIKAQTVVALDLVSFVYLDTHFTYNTADSTMSYQWHVKDLSLPFKVNKYTHWSSMISYSCKLGMIATQTRSACRSASSLSILHDNLSLVAAQFISIGYPKDLVIEHVARHSKIYLARFPTRF